jgi:hypothetical protein
VQNACRSRRHKSGGTLPPAPGLRICSACLELAEEALLRLPQLADLCANGLTARERGVVLCDTVLSMRSEILGVLATWCGFVSAERGVPEPDEPAVQNFVGFLGIHLYWLCQHPTAPDLVDALTALSAAAGKARCPGHQNERFRHAR